MQIAATGSNACSRTRHAGERTEYQDRQADVENEAEQLAALRLAGPLQATRDDSDKEQRGDRGEAPVGGEDVHVLNLAQSLSSQSETS